ncbi:MAG: hypothetical protein RLZZ210_765 [Pseudomonadota bacterium]|jgi:STE24 endopeptidase
MLPSYLFIAFILIILTMQIYLACRQIKHISNNYANVPINFAEYTSLEQHQKSSKYSLAKLKISIFEYISETVILVIFTLCGGLQYIDSYLSHNIQNEYLYAIALFSAVFGISSIVGLPFAYIRQFKIEQAFGFNNMTLGLFISDAIKQALLSSILLFPLLCAGLLLLKQNNGWFYAWLIWIGFNVLIMLIYPKYLAPIFNKFTKLDENKYADLISKMHNLFNNANFKLTDILVMDGSKRSSHGNAYFTGFGKSKRIVFFDTLLNNMNENQTISILAHELGHLAHKHLIKRLISSFIFSLAFFYIIHILYSFFPFYQFMGVAPHLFGITSIHSNYPLLIILLLLIMPFASFIFTPIASHTSRKHEFEADAFAVKHTNSADLTSALIKLYNDNSSLFTHDELYSKFYYSHPPANERIKAISFKN